MADATNRYVNVERTAGVLTATLSRTPVNAIDDTMLAQLDAVLDQAQGD